MSGTDALAVGSVYRMPSGRFAKIVGDDGANVTLEYLPDRDPLAAKRPRGDDGATVTRALMLGSWVYQPIKQPAALVGLPYAN